jgi:hypothetical protein
LVTTWAGNTIQSGQMICLSAPAILERSAIFTPLAREQGSVTVLRATRGNPNH